eukprot:5027696-Amphidinium_carterae.1
MQNLLDDVEMTDLTEYLQMKQYHNYLNYHDVTTRLQMTRENMSQSSRKPSTITAECCSTS